MLVNNLVAATKGEKGTAEYDGYASCPLLTGHGELMLCEFKYGGVPKETFADVLGGQEIPNRFFYHLKKDLFVSFNLPLRLFFWSEMDLTCVAVCVLELVRYWAVVWAQGVHQARVLVGLACKMPVVSG